MKIKFFHSKVRVILLSIIVVLSSIAFISFDDRDDFELAKNLEVYNSLIRELRLFYVDDFDFGKLVKTSIDKMLESLDPYTNYYSEAEMEEFKFMTTGEYGGIGASVIKVNNNIIITEPFYGYPAHKAGLRAGDIILRIQGISVDGKTLDDLSKLLKGQPNSAIKIIIKRPGVDGNIEKTVFRENIAFNNVPYYNILKNNIGYIKLTGFTETAYKEFREAFTDLRSKTKLSGLVIDLRDNPGGLLIAAVDIMNLFVNKGQQIVSTKGKVKQWNKIFYGTNNPIDTEVPIVVLVNRGSASASEIVSGSFQDLDRGVIVGQRTFGKGLVQTTRDLSYNAKLKITTAKYYIPSGRCIQALDYTHRNEDGSVGKVPDSLISQFNTLNGRKVFDGGGILPDKIVENVNLNKISLSLIAKNLIFDFATFYRLKHDSIESVEKFSISNSDYNGFVEFVKNKNFDYITDSEKALDNFIEATNKEKYTNLIKDEVKSLKNKMLHDKLNDLYIFKDEIKKLLNEEIISRYYFQKGKIQYELQNDDYIFLALSILTNNDFYYSLLNGGYLKKDNIK